MFFYFKQKTAYDVRISDWSSDVCSSDLANQNRDCGVLILTPFERMIARRYLLPGKSEAFIALVAGISVGVVMLSVAMLVVVMSVMNGFRAELLEIGRASCRERVCQYG